MNWPAGQLVGLLLQLVDLVAQLGGDLGHPVGVHLHAAALHLGQHRHQRQLDVGVERGHLALLDALGQPRVDGDLGTGGGHQRRRLGVGLDGRGDALLLGQVGDLIAGAAGVEQVGGELRVAGGKQAGDVLAVGDHAVTGERVDQRGGVVGGHDQHVA